MFDNALYVSNSDFRYITWPGQATSYKIGELQIQKLRKKRQEELGKDFDLSKFHRHILTCLGPIEMLEECVKEEEKLPFPTKPRNYNYKRDPKSIQNGGNISKISTSLILFMLIICKYI